MVFGIGYRFYQTLVDLSRSLAPAIAPLKKLVLLGRMHYAARSLRPLLQAPISGFVALYSHVAAHSCGENLTKNRLSVLCMHYPRLQVCVNWKLGVRNNYE